MPIARPTVIAAVLAAGLIGLHAQSSPEGRTLVEYDFAASAEGWLVSGDTGATKPVFHPSGGNPGGHISHVDEAVGETWYFRAPESVLKQLAAAENGTLTYSLKQSSDDTGFLDDDVVIVGPAGRLSWTLRECAMPWSRRGRRGSRAQATGAARWLVPRMARQGQRRIAPKSTSNASTSL